MFSYGLSSAHQILATVLMICFAYIIVKFKKIWPIIPLAWISLNLVVHGNWMNVVYNIFPNFIADKIRDGLTGSDSHAPLLNNIITIALIALICKGCWHHFKSKNPDT